MKKRILAMLLAISLCMSAAAMPAFAAEDDEKTETETVSDDDFDANSNDDIFPKLDLVNHVNYINGKGEGRFDPDGSLTRAEAAKMIAALVADKEMGEKETEFSDVEEDSWYAPSVAFLASWGILNGYENEDEGTVFRPEANITRAEFVTILCRFYDVGDGDNPFSDVEDDSWAASFIVTAAEKGWINGYEDGSFEPEQNITRAEAVKVINAALGRSAAEKETAELIEMMGARIFIDVEPEDWYYSDVMEASVPHEYAFSNSSEIWSEITYIGCGYESGWNTIGDFRYYVNENGQFEAYPAGMQWIDGIFYYVDEQGRIPLNAAGKYAIDGAYYYVDENGKVPQNAAGMYALSNSEVYMVDAAGRICYLSPGIHEINQEMYYVNADGTIAVDTTVGYLYFGDDGAYTTGSAKLDDMVDNALAACVTSSMTQAEKLRAAYVYIRDNFTYLARDHQARGTMDWAQESAEWMFTYNKGNCYCFAAVFLYMARRLGYQAYPVSGGVGTKNSDHAWVMIYWEDGNPYMFDVELDYAYRYRYDRGVIYDLYKFTPETAPFKYYFPS